MKFDTGVGTEKVGGMARLGDDIVKDGWCIAPYFISFYPLGQVQWQCEERGNGMVEFRLVMFSQPVL